MWSHITEDMQASIWSGGTCRYSAYLFSLILMLTALTVNTDAVFLSQHLKVSAASNTTDNTCPPASEKSTSVCKYCQKLEFSSFSQSVYL